MPTTTQQPTFTVDQGKNTNSVSLKLIKDDGEEVEFTVFFAEGVEAVI
jgi:hypothetical protein